MIVHSIIYDNEKYITYNVSTIISDITVDTSIFDNAGKCTFKVLNLPNFSFKEGATFALVVNGYRLFKGYVFKRRMSKDKKQIEVTCYDALRYLKNQDTKTYEGLTSAQIFADACNDLVLPYTITSSSSYPTAPVVHDAKSYYDMIKTALDETLTNTKKYYIIRDNFGVLQHVNVLDLRAPFFVSDESNLVNFTYETSIDTDTYNQIKLYRDNDETEKRDIFIVNDTAVNNGENIRKWGILQLYQKVDESLNTAQVEDLAFKMLALYNNTKRELKLTEVIGFLPMSAGYVFPCRISGTLDEDINNWLLCTSCQHKISGGVHTMNLTSEVVPSEWG